jgi:2-polyprenyl-3-methyl-5-hydroxy-6-metoxy-1,4-benzoquinol methylase
LYVYFVHDNIIETDMAYLGLRTVDDQQRAYYDQFGRKYKQQILSSEDPSVWTTDFSTRGPSFQDMQSRVGKQAELISAFFSPEHPVLDVGCGFGRQAFLMANRGFRVVGVDTSQEFIDIARCLFDQRGLTNAVFHCGSIFDISLGQRFRQAVLFDVLEHVVPEDRVGFLQSLVTTILEPNAVMIVTVPVLRYNSLRRILNRTGFRIAPDTEHPYYSPTMRDIARLCRPMCQVVKHEIVGRTRFIVLRRT